MRITVAEIVTTHGIRGNLKVKSLSDYEKRFENGAKLLIGDEELTVESSFDQKGLKVIKFKEYDDINNGTDLLRTLYFYLVEERSLIKASQRLNVHRNSIVYRINKINELVDINLDCYKARKNIISALEIIDRLDNTLKITEEDI